MASPFNSVPNGVSTSAQSPDRMAALMALQQLFGASGGGSAGAGPSGGGPGPLPPSAQGPVPGMPGGPGGPQGLPPDLMAAMSGGGASGPGGPGAGPGGPPPGAPPSPPMQPGAGPYNVPAPDPMAQDPNAEAEMDLFQRVTQLIMDPSTKQMNPQMLLLFAGMGLREALEKSGKFVSKPHRSNQELQGMGIDTGMPGQTGMPNPQQLAQKAEAPSMGGMPGFPGGG